MSTVAIDADGFQVACWDIPLPWTPDDVLPPSADFNIEPDSNTPSTGLSPRIASGRARERDERGRGDDRPNRRGLGRGRRSESESAGSAR